MPWTTESPPPPAKNWTDAEKRKCVEAANAALKDTGDEEQAIFACIAAVAAGKGANGMDRKMGLLENIMNWLNPQQGGLVPQNFTLNKWTPAVLVPKAKAESNSGFKIAEVNGKAMWFAYTTNAFVDRDEEIFTTKALEDYASLIDKGEVPAEVKVTLESLKLPTAPQGELWLMHIPRSKVGEPLWRAVEGRFLLEAGVFDDTPMAKAVVAHLKGHAEEYGLSHGYLYNPSDREDGVYDWFWKFETSLLPVGWAANPWTRFEVKETMEANMIDAKKREELLKLAGGDEGLVNTFLEGASSLGAKLEAEGVSHKEAASEAVAEVVAEPEAEPKVEDPEAKVEEPEVKAVADTKALDELVAAVKALDAKFVGIADQITAAVKPVADDVARLKAESETYARVSSRKSWIRPSQAASTEIPADEAKKVVADASLIDPANLSDVVAANLKAKMEAASRR